MPISKKNFNGFRCILAGIICNLIFGTMYLWANINIYVTTYFRLHGNEWLTINTTTYIYPTWELLRAIGIYFGIRIGKFLGYKKAIMIFTTGFAVSVFISAYTESFWTFMFFYGLMAPLFSGLAEYIPVHCSWMYFP